MKSGIHPEVNEVLFEDVSTGTQFISSSTLTGEKTATVDGKEYSVITVDITSASHPFFTGKQTLVDTAGRVDKFKNRMEKKTTIGEVKSKKEKKAAQKTKKSTKKEA